MTDPKEVADALRYPRADVVFNAGLTTKCPKCETLYEMDFSWANKKKMDCRKCGVTFRLRRAW
jgi:hypothetical protein